MAVLTTLSVLLAVIFAALGAAKVAASAPMRALAADAGFSVTAYRSIGALELLGATGLLTGLVVPFIGGLAGAGLLALLVGAVITHVRNGDPARKLTPALACGLLVAGYLTALAMSW